LFQHILKYVKPEPVPWASVEQHPTYLTCHGDVQA